jgi:hypothetical protein
VHPLAARGASGKKPSVGKPLALPVVQAHRLPGEPPKSGARDGRVPARADAPQAGAADPVRTGSPAGGRVMRIWGAAVLGGSTPLDCYFALLRVIPARVVFAREALERAVAPLAVEPRAAVPRAVLRLVPRVLAVSAAVALVAAALPAALAALPAARTASSPSLSIRPAARFA